MVFSAMAMGQGSSFAPEAGKARHAAARLFAIIERVPSIDIESDEGLTPVRMGHVCVGSLVALKLVHLRGPRANVVRLFLIVRVTVESCMNLFGKGIWIWLFREDNIMW